jgi:predicted transcriptional regulator of viral defense system
MAEESKILTFMEEQGGYATSKDITSQGINHYYLKKLLEKGEVEKVKRGLYRLGPSTLKEELAEVCAIVPKGILCLYSAWAYHDLSDFVPSSYHIAIEKTRKASLPGYPPIQLYFWSGASLDLGVMEAKADGGHIRVFDLEKSVCDAIRMRNKIGKEIEKEVLHHYLRRPDRNLDRLMKYAKALRVANTLKTYLNILL